MFVTVIILSCSSSDDPEPSDLRNEDITTSANGFTLVHFHSEKQTIRYENPAESFYLGRLELSNDYFVSASPTKMGVIASTGQAFFQSAPNGSITLRTSSPFNAQWLNPSKELLNGAITGLNYVYVDDNQNGSFETIFLIRFNGAEPENVSKTYIVGKVVKEDGTSIGFAEAKTLLDTLEK